LAILKTPLEENQVIVVPQTEKMQVMFDGAQTLTAQNLADFRKKYQPASASEMAAAERQMIERWQKMSFNEILDFISKPMGEKGEIPPIVSDKSLIDAARAGNVEAILELKNSSEVISWFTQHVAIVLGVLQSKFQQKIDEIVEEKDKEEKPEEEEAAPETADYSDGGGWDGGYVATETETDKPAKTDEESAEKTEPEKEEKLSAKQQKIAEIKEKATQSTEFYGDLYELAGKLPVEGASSLLSESFEHFSNDQRVSILMVIDEALTLATESPDGGRIYGVGIVDWFGKKIIGIENKGNSNMKMNQSLKEYLGLQGYNDSLSTTSGSNVSNQRIIDTARGDILNLEAVNSGVGDVADLPDVPTESLQSPKNLDADQKPDARHAMHVVAAHYANTRRPSPQEEFDYLRKAA